MSTVSSVFQVLNVPSFWLAFTVGSSAARQPCATTGFRLQKDLSRFTSWFRIADDSQPWDVRLSMSIGARAQHLRLVSPYSHFLRRWLVFCAATFRTTPHSSLLTQHFTMSASLSDRFATCFAAPVRPVRSHGSIVPVTGLVPRWRRWREWTSRLQD